MRKKMSSRRECCMALQRALSLDTEQKPEQELMPESNRSYVYFRLEHIHFLMDDLSVQFAGHLLVRVQCGVSLLTSAKAMWEAELKDERLRYAGTVPSSSLGNWTRHTRRRYGTNGDPLNSLDTNTT